MATNEQINQALVSYLVVSNSQPSAPGNQVLISALSAFIIQPSQTLLVVRPPTSNAVVTAGVTGNPPIQATMSTAAQV